MAYHNCAPYEPNVVFDYGDRYHRWASYCGSHLLLKPEQVTAEGLKRERLLSDCPKCAAAIGKAKLAQYGERVRLEKREPEHSWYRSNYAIFIDGVERGLIVCESGWGKGWGLCAMPNSGGYRERVSSGKPNRWEARNFGDDRTFWPIHYAARDAMACAAVKAAEAGFMPTVAESMAQAEQRKAEKAEREAEAERSRLARAAERERQEEVRQTDVALARAALEALRGRPDLTNAEATGLASLAILAGLETRESN